MDSKFPDARWHMAQGQMIDAWDVEICRRIASGESAAEEDLVRRFQPGLMAIARVRAGRERAADLVQETLAIALPNLRRGDWTGRGPLAAYLATILRRLVLRGRRRPMPEAEIDLTQIPGTSSDPAVEAERSETRALLRMALERLPSHHREVLLRHYIDDQSAEEIARQLGVARGTVLSRLHHARAKMARIMNHQRPGRHR